MCCLSVNLWSSLFVLSFFIVGCSNSTTPIVDEKNVENPPILVASISVMGDDTVFVGEKITLVKSVLPKNAEDTTVFWNSSDSGIATVDNMGNVQGIEVGVVTISALAQDESSSQGDKRIVVTLKDIDKDGIADSVDRDKDGDGYLEINTIEQLDSIRYNRNASFVGILGTDSSRGFQKPIIGFELTRDLDFEDGNSYGDGVVDNRFVLDSGWIPIDTLRAALLGNGHVVKNLRIVSERESVGLVSFLDSVGIVDGVGVEADTVHIANSTGFRSQAGVLVGVNKGVIKNSYAKGNLVNAATSRYGYVGGLVGSNFGIITNTYGLCSVMSLSTSSRNSVGGLVGYNRVDGVVENSLAGGSIVTYSSYGGGLASRNDGTIKNSFAFGTVSADSSIVGGLVGYSYQGSIQNSYSVSTTVSKHVSTGGLLGNHNNSNVENSYWDTEASGQGSSVIGEGKTTVVLQSPVSNTGIYDGWSSSIWDFGGANEYPGLKVWGVIWRPE